MSTTHQQDAPKCTAADGLAEIFNVPGHPLLVRAVDFNRLHAENETLRMGYAAARLEIETLKSQSAAQQPDIENLRKALQFYAGSEHFIKSDGDAWDNVSGEPQNYWCDEAGTATVEDGSIARLALSGQPVQFEDDTPQSEQPGAAYAALPESLILAVDRWFSANTGLGGCSDKDVRELAELFYGVTHAGGRESVDDALAIVESFGPGIDGLNDTYTRQILLADEVKRLRASHGQAPAQAAPVDAIASILNEVMEIAVSNGANSVSMPDHYVEVAAWLAAAPTTQPAPNEDEGISREQWIEQAMRVYLIAGDTELQAEECAKYLWGELDLDDLADPYDAAMSDVEGRGPAPQPSPAAQGDALPREELAWLVVQEACETEPADQDDPECIRILRRDLKSSVLAAFLRHDAARAAQEGKSHG